MVEEDKKVNTYLDQDNTSKNHISLSRKKDMILENRQDQNMEIAECQDQDLINMKMQFLNLDLRWNPVMDLDPELILKMEVKYQDQECMKQRKIYIPTSEE